VKLLSSASTSEHLLCPLCEAGELLPFGSDCARYGLCGYILGLQEMVPVSMTDGGTRRSSTARRAAPRCGPLTAAFQ